MTLEKAIKDSEARVAGEFSIQGEDDCADIKLGIEALKRIQEARVKYHSVWGDTLPSETEE